jgi:hypothetical protein
MTAWLVVPFVGHFAIVVLLYIWLSVLRVAAVRAGRMQLADYVRADADQGLAGRVQRNLQNQFEAPLFAYASLAIILSAQAVTAWDVAAMWIFLVGRIVHTLVQTLTTNVPLRGSVFAINFVGVMMLVGHVAWLAAMGTVQ